MDDESELQSARHMLTGTRSGYWVVQWSHDWDPSLTDLLEQLPDLVLGRYVSIASCDSGPYRPTDNELQNGWEVTADTATSSRIGSVSDLPVSGFDEWYVHERRPSPYSYQSFVNAFGFSPLTASEDTLNQFWAQVEATRPLHVLGAGTPTMFIVTRDENSFKRAKLIGGSSYPALRADQL